MPCEHRNGMIICSRARRVPPCKFCSGFKPSTKLCDFVLGEGSGGKSAVTCDAPMCDRHATNVGPNKDYCPIHKESQ